MICQNCGASLDEEDIFCQKCGAKNQFEEPDTPPDESAQEETASEEAMFCPACGAEIRVGDKFCGRCGADQNPDSPANLARALPKKPSLTVYKGKRRHDKDYFYKSAVTLIFLAAIGGVAFAANRYLLDDIPWSDVAAVITGHRSKPAKSDFSVSPPPIADTEGDAVSDTPDASPDVVSVADVKPVWSQEDENGYSVLTAPGLSAEFGGTLSLTGKVNADKVRLRETPDTKSRILGRFDRGDELDVIGRYVSRSEKYPWFRVARDGQDGWMYGQFLRVTEE
jgi:hypothetical protein